MNIIRLHKPNITPEVPKALFSRMDKALQSAGADFAKSVRIAKTIAPILQDQSSNDLHLGTLSSDAPVQDKIIAVLMLGFPKNRHVLPVLKSILNSGPDSLRIASAIAISHMKDSENCELLSQILGEAFKATDSSVVKKAIHKASLKLKP